MMGLESSVTWRGTDKVGATSLALPPVYARCLPEDALTTGGIAVTGIGLPGPSSAYGQRRRAMANRGPVRARHDHGGTQLAAWPARLRGCRAAVCPRHVAACSRRGEIAWSTDNLQQAARVADWTTLLLAEEPTRRPGWSRRADGQGSSPRQGLQPQGRQHGGLGRCARSGGAFMRSCAPLRAT